eukprot:2201073-Alexandrium_andersonii.AAC.1
MATLIHAARDHAVRMVPQLAPLARPARPKLDRLPARRAPLAVAHKALPRVVERPPKSVLARRAVLS